MAVKSYNPTSPARRQMTVADFSELTDKQPEKNLLVKRSKTGGRNSYGRITVRHKGGGNKRKIRIIDWKRAKEGMKAKVVALEYDPNRTANLALIQYLDGEKAYILAPEGLKVGDFVEAGAAADIVTGNCLKIENIPVGTIIHNIELKPGKGAQMVRTAGAGAQLMAKEEKYAQVRLPSGEVRMVSVNCKATIGNVGNSEHENISIGKAGRNRWLGRRPEVRGVAMNPIDHPLGGGEGRSSGGRHPVSPWGMPTRGYKTRNRKKASSKLIVKRRR